MNRTKSVAADFIKPYSNQHNRPVQPALRVGALLILIWYAFARVFDANRPSGYQTNLDRVFSSRNGFLIVLFGRFLPQWFHPGYGVLLAVAILIAFTVRNRRRAHAEAGLKPKKGGYSAKLDLLKEKLRARAEEIEAAQRFSREVEDLPPALGEFVEEIRKTAKDVHHREFVPNPPSVLQEDSNILDILAEIKEGFPSAEDVPTMKEQVSKYVSDLQKSASEVEAYATEVRSQGGVYKLAGGQLAGCSLLLLGCLAYGGYLIWQYYTSPRWELWAGMGMIAVALLVSYVLYRMQTEPA